MHSSIPTSTPAALPDHVEALLRHLPEHVREAYMHVGRLNDFTAADTLVLAIVTDHMPDKQMALVDSASLVRDLGSS